MHYSMIIEMDYRVSVTNRFKRLDLIDRMPEELGTEVHDIVQEAVIKTIQKRNKYPVLLPGESRERGSLVGCRLWGCTESDTTEVT